MDKINFGEIFKKSFLMTWKNKTMWIFGFMVFLGNLTLNFNSRNKEFDFGKIGLGNQDGNILIFVVIVIIMAAFFLLGLWGRASLIKMSDNITLYHQLNIKSILNESKKHLGRLMILDILVGAITIAVALALLSPAIYLFSTGSSSMATAFLFLSLILFGIFFTLAFYIIKFANIYVVLGGMKIHMSLESAYELFEKNIKKNIFFGLILISLIFLFLLASFLIILAILSIGLLINFLLNLALPQTGSIISLYLNGFIIISSVFILASWLQAFTQASWVIYFREIAFKKTDEEEKESILNNQAILPNPEAV